MRANLADDNNNKAEKYSLRPRALSSKRGRTNGDEDNEYEMWTLASKGRCKKKSKQRPAPLSKYRRKTANARERCRMREINDGFEALRRVLPQILSENGDGGNEKLTKISTLRLAMRYIATLNRILYDTTTTTTTLSSNIVNSELSSNIVNTDCESDGDSLFSGSSEYASTMTAPSSSSSSVKSSVRSPPPIFGCQSACERTFCMGACRDSSASGIGSDCKMSGEWKSSQTSIALASSIALPSLSLPLNLPLPLDDDFVLSEFAVDVKQELMNDIGTDAMDPLNSCLNDVTFDDDDDEYAFDGL